MDDSYDPYENWLDIAPADQPPNHYQLLGIDLFEEDPDVVRQAADERMKHVRTFQHGRRSKLSQRILNELSSARVCLLDAEKKAEYDAKLRAETAAVEAVPLPPARPPRPVAAPPVAPVQAAAPPEVIKRRRSGRRPRAPLLLAGGGMIALLLVGVVITAIALVRLRQTANKPRKDKRPKDTPGQVQRHQLEEIEDMVIAGGEPTRFVIRPSGRKWDTNYQVRLEKGPDGAAIDPGTAEFLWTPTDSQSPGEYRVVIQLVALETDAVVSNVRFKVRVRDADPPLVFDAVRDQVVEEGDALTLQLSASDPEGGQSAVSYAIQQAPEGAVIDSDSGVLSWSPQPGQGSREYTVVVTAAPAAGGREARAEFTIRCLAGLGTTDGRGLRAEVFAGAAMIVKRQIRVQHLLEWYASDQPRQESAPGHHLRCRGWLRPPLAGTYRFVVAANGGVRIRIGELRAIVLEGRQNGPPWELDAEVELAAEPTPFVLEFSSRRPASFFQTRWTRPDGVSELLPASALFHREDVALAATPVDRPPTTDATGLQVDVYGDAALENSLATGVAPQIDACWSAKPPDGIGAKSPFAMRYRGLLTAPQPGSYEFAVAHDGQVKLILDGELLASGASHLGPKRTTAEVELSGQHQFEVVYVHRFGPALLSLRWVPPGASAERIIPTSAFTRDRAQLLGKLPVPDQQKLDEARSKVEAAYADELRRGRNDSEILNVLARQLIQNAAALDDTEDPVTHFATLEVAQSTAASAGNAALSWHAIDKLDEQFLLKDSLALKSAALREAARQPQPRESSANLANLYFQLISELARRSEYQAALDQITRASSVAVKSGSRFLRTSVSTRGQELRELVAEQSKFKRANETLEAEPANAQAAFVRGRYLCLFANDDQQGLPLLAKAESVPHRDAAQLEMAGAEDIAAMRELGDAWNRVANVEDDQGERRSQQRALRWYRNAMDRTDGVEAAELAAEVDALRVAISRGEVPAAGRAEAADAALVRAVASKIVESKSGYLRIAGLDDPVRKPSQLPEEAFTLTGLVLSDPKLNDDNLQTIARIETLKSVSVTSANVTNKGIAYLRSLRRLESLTIKGGEVDDRAVSLVLDMPRLKHLSLQGLQFTGATVARLDELPALESLTIGGPMLGDATLMEAARCRSLQMLKIVGGRFEPLTLLQLKHHDGLTTLRLEGENIDDDTLLAASNLPQIRSLAVTGRVSAAGVRALQRMEGLRTLEVESDQIGDEDLAAFRDFRNLRDLTLNTQIISNAGLKHLVAIAGLTQLTLANAGGVDNDGLSILVEMPAAEKIMLYDATYDLRGYREFREARPDCQLYPEREQDDQ